MNNIKSITDYISNENLNKDEIAKVWDCCRGGCLRGEIGKCLR